MNFQMTRGSITQYTQLNILANAIEDYKKMIAICSTAAAILLNCLYEQDEKRPLDLDVRESSQTRFLRLTEKPTVSLRKLIRGRGGS